MKPAYLFSLFYLLFSTSALANDFPTQARIEFVLDCMDENGGQSYNTLYPCICAIDRIAADMPYERYEYAQTMSVMIQTPGERGSAFRDAPGARKLVKEYKALLKSTRASCFVSAPPQPPNM